MTDRGGWLIFGGCLSLAASALHVGAIVGGSRWYRFMGAGERMAQAVERGEWRPALVTAGIAVVLAIWGCYAFSGAGIIVRLPLLRVGLIAISAIYLLRGMVLFVPSALRRPDLSAGFLFWSSSIVLALGLIHAIGTWRAWNMLD